MTIILDEATPLLERMRTAAQAQGLARVGARAGATLVREHLFGLDGQRHQYGRHYYAQAARSVTTGVVPEGAAISITQTGFRQRLKGGDIEPVNAHALTLPEAPEAYGHRAGEFHDLHKTKRVNPKTGALQWCLVRNLSTPISIRHRRQKDGSIKTSITAHAERGGEVMYWLVRHVHQEPDPTVLPYPEHIAARALEAMQKHLLGPGPAAPN